MSDFTIKQGDTLPALAVTLRKPDKTPQSIVGATVRFNMRDANGDVVIDHAAVQVIDAPTGQVEYVWQTGDTDESGNYQYEFEVDFGGGQIETYPNKKNEKLTIHPQIA